MMSPIAVSATLTAKPGREEEAQNVLLEVLKHSRNEEGCLHYNLHQSQDDPKVFMLYELWKDQNAIDSHIESAHYQTYRTNIEPLIDVRNVQKWNQIG
ncbi:Quinol monooxygenase YgiN [Bacillus sp. OV194]|uniref:putative quinol monooxygenase n=1 Tax=Fictibacillus sp. B-59209 TaxID=3024873 RepID=UPI0006A7C9BC|nr:putative quinol monooxygenase [Fictibacillus sp. B-59209]MED2973809.1 putative quinol monooxygenase [Fictibacillus sp. B-59209]SFE34269.1 Quinol monooxygenase YgiN [Bacillus sp. OV194]